MLNKLSIHNCSIRWFSKKVKYKINDVVNEMIENSSLKPRKHPGILYPGTIKMPENIQNTMKLVLEDVPYKSLLEDAKQLRRHLHGKCAPVEKHVYHDLYQHVQNSFVLDEKGVDACIAEINDSYSKNHNKTLKYIKQKIHNSAAENYDAKNSILYLLGRSMQDYAVLTKIFYEIKQRDPKFVPESIFDFGSGVGTVMWAAFTMWHISNKTQYFAVDISKDMIELADKILTKLKPDMKQIYFKEYMPITLQPTFDMTVSAYSLMELPSLKERVNTLYSLWRKTKKYMIIVENGTNAGFNLINEARDLILYASKKEKPTYIFSPCPNDLDCPRVIKNDNTPCNFETIYYELPFYEKNCRKNELFSYVVFKKGSRNGEEWPRIVRPVQHRSKHSWCELCTSAGELHNLVFTKSKDKYLYKCIKSSDWGDRIPAHEVSEGTEEQDKTSSSSQMGQPSSESDSV